MLVVLALYWIRVDKADYMCKNIIKIFVSYDCAYTVYVSVLVKTQKGCLLIFRIVRSPDRGCFVNCCQTARSKLLLQSDRFCFSQMYTSSFNLPSNHRWHFKVCISSQLFPKFTYIDAIAIPVGSDRSNKTR